MVTVTQRVKNTPIKSSVERKHRRVPEPSSSNSLMNGVVLTRKNTILSCGCYSALPFIGREQSNQDINRIICNWVSLVYKWTFANDLTLVLRRLIPSVHHLGINSNSILSHPPPPLSCSILTFPTHQLTPFLFLIRNSSLVLHTVSNQTRSAADPNQ